ncbi:MAG: type I restriction-modification system subunit M [Clostridiales bacterium]|nr:type I restriction-modification system subunit M [Clostridiales bacterium]
MARKKMAATSFEEKIWDAADVLRSHISASEYRKIVIGLIFLWYIYNAFEERYELLVEEGYGYENDPAAYTERNVFFVPEVARWDTIAAAAHTPEIGVIINEAMKAVEESNPELKGILPKNYADSDIDKRVLGKVVDIFTDMDLADADTEDSRDLLGRTYEYCLMQFAANEGTKGGEYYTPSSIVKTIVEILHPFSKCRVYDPCCGSGGMFIQSMKFVQAHSGNMNISVYGQESNADTWKMAKMNMAIHGIDADLGTSHADTFFQDMHPDLSADFIMANPPFNTSGWGQEELAGNKRWKYGVPPAGNANFAWIQHMISHLAPHGKIGLVLANGSLTGQYNGEGKIRENIIKDDLVEGIVAMPPQLFYRVSIPVCLWIIAKSKRQRGKILFVNARNMGYMADRRHREFTEKEITKIADAFSDFETGTLEPELGFCGVATLEQVKENDYMLTPGRYVGLPQDEDDGIPYERQMETLSAELSELYRESHALEEKVREQLAAIGYEI